VIKSWQQDPREASWLDLVAIGDLVKMGALLTLVGGKCDFDGHGNSIDIGGGYNEEE
jgi:hypothetical protein